MLLATDGSRTMLNDRPQFDWLLYTIHHNLRAENNPKSERISTIEGEGKLLQVKSKY